MIEPACITRWHLNDVTPLAETATSQLWRAVSAEHGDVVVKRLKPAGAGEIHGVGWLRWCDGQGAAQLYDLHQDTILMESVPGPSLGDMARFGKDREAAQKLAELATRQQSSKKLAPANLLKLNLYLNDLFTVSPGALPEAGRAGVAHARALARLLFDTVTDERPLHGDLHHDNILHSPRGWLAIDPKGVLGDPAFEFANALRNPEGAMDQARDPARAVSLAQLFQTLSGHAASRILDWAIVLCATSMAWNRADAARQSDDVVLLNTMQTARKSLPTPELAL